MREHTPTDANAAGLAAQEYPIPFGWHLPTDTAGQEPNPRPAKRPNPTKSGLVLIFATEAVSIPITLSIKNCIVMSGLLLRSIALNLGIDAATARYLINQWRPSPVEQGVIGGDE